MSDDEEFVFEVVRDPQDVSQLHPDLQPYVEEHAVLEDTLMLRHPLVYSVPFSSWHWCNQLYQQKLRMVEEARRRQDWGGYLTAFERPYRMVQLHELWQSKRVSVPELRKLLPPTWTDTEFPWRVQDLALEMFRATGYVTDGPVRPERTVTCFRGQKVGAPLGLSWTTDPVKAEWFARRFNFNGEHHVLRASVRPASILARFNNRGEREVIIDPQAVHYTATGGVK